MTPAEPLSRRLHDDVDGPVALRGTDASRREMWNGLDQASIMVVELLAGILVWGGVGWLLDRWLGTWPWLFGFGVMVGFGAGLALVWLRSRAPEPAQQEQQDTSAESVRAAVDQEGP